MKRSSIVWFHSDLRLEDNPALAQAIEKGDPLYPVFIWSPEEEGSWQPGAASRWWLHYALEDLQHQLEGYGLRLTIMEGESLHCLQELVKKTNANAAYWNTRYEPALLVRDTRIAKVLNASGVEANACHANLLYEPGKLLKSDGTPYKVFTPFLNYCLKQSKSPLINVEVKYIKAPESYPKTLPLHALKLLPKIKWDATIAKTWDPTVKAAKRNLKKFCADAIARYNVERDFPGREGTSRLSPYLHFGQISPQQIWQAIEASPHIHSNGARVFFSEIVWREFAYYLLHHFPHTTDSAFKEEFNHFSWKYNEAHLRAWQTGQTGYPIIDAGMRQLWQTGWMHNRVRMIVGSFLVKDLLQHWQAGAEWFWDTLVDADLANNTLGWQWVAGSGADASPYFRIFNPVLQSRKYDPEGEYIKQYLPELQLLPVKYLHEPWKAPPAVLSLANIELGKTYPQPIIDHNQARGSALLAYAKIRSK